MQKQNQLPMREERYCSQCGKSFFTSVQAAVCTECLNKNYYNKKEDY